MKRIVFSLVALGLSCPVLAQDLDQTVEQFQQQAAEQRAKQEACIANWNDAQFQAADPILVNERFLLKDGSVQGFNYDPEIVRNNDECLTGDVVSLMDQQNPPGCITPSTVSDSWLGRLPGHDVSLGGGWLGALHQVKI